jgi:hypothetical protein
MNSIVESATTRTSEPDPVEERLARIAANKLAEVKQSKEEVDFADSPGWYDLEEFLWLKIDPARGIIPGLLEEDHRVILLGDEGAGKSEVCRQVGVALTRGIHPFTFAIIEPKPVLIVDLEDPLRSLQRRLEYVAAQADKTSKREPEKCTLWLRPGGVDLRQKRTRDEVEYKLTQHRPKLVVISSLYKSYARKANESDEAVAVEMQSIFDDLRSRHGFALAIEHHAGQFQSDGSRHLRPYGSSLWLRWPEFGWGMKRTDDAKKFRLERWRGPRDWEVRWPDEIHVGSRGSWPWEGYYENGLPTADERAF